MNEVVSLSVLSRQANFFEEYCHVNYRIRSQSQRRQENLGDITFDSFFIFSIGN